MKILHNPRCRKSRETLQLLQDKGINPEVLLYLKEVPTFEELNHIINLLNIKPLQLIRKTESIFKDEFKDKTLSDDEWIRVMIENPKLIERPIVINGNKAVIGRPPQQSIIFILS